MVGVGWPIDKQAHVWRASEEGRLVVPGQIHSYSSRSRRSGFIRALAVSGRIHFQG